MITTDIHVHSSFSGDSSEEMENVIKAAIEKKMTHLCFTEHMDMDFPLSDGCKENVFYLDVESYYGHFVKMREKYSGKITLLFGMEWGMQPHLVEEFIKLSGKYPFDFIIGSQHTVNRKDPYYPAFYEGRSEYEAYCEYFEDIIRNLDALSGAPAAAANCIMPRMSDADILDAARPRMQDAMVGLAAGGGFSTIDTLGHLDYVVRYGPNMNREYSYLRYGDFIDEILKRLVDRGIALEVNTGGYKYGLGEPNPCVDIIKRYREFKGELITIGSDAHEAKRLMCDFDAVRKLLGGLGYKYHAVFEKRKALMLEL